MRDRSLLAAEMLAVVDTEVSKATLSNLNFFDLGGARDFGGGRRLGGILKI